MGKGFLAPRNYWKGIITNTDLKKDKNNLVRSGPKAERTAAQGKAARIRLKQTTDGAGEGQKESGKQGDKTS